MRAFDDERIASTPGARGHHPAGDALERFMYGESPRSEAMAIVRHALQGCPRCNLLAWWLWERGPKKRPAAVALIRRRPPAQVVSIESHLDRRSPLIHPFIQAQLEVRSIVHELVALRYRLLGVQASLPASSAETDRLLETDPLDPASDLRTTIDCVLKDYLGPAEEVLGLDNFQKFKQQLAERAKDAEGEGQA
jgi:hypothetical protein